MLPPHSGHTQFRMPDITSELALSIPHLVTCIYASTNERTVSCLAPTFGSGTFRRSQKLNPNSCMHFPFQHCGERSNVALIKKHRPRCWSRHQREKWQCAKSDSRLRSPASPRSFMPLRRRLVLSASLERKSGRRGLEKPSHHRFKPRFSLSPKL